jgi:hypothetical protein
MRSGDYALLAAYFFQNALLASTIRRGCHKEQNLVWGVIDD